ENAALEGQDAVVIRRAVPQHGARRHDAAPRSMDDLQVAGAAGFLGHAIVARIDEADELRALAIEQRVRALGVGGAGPAPLLAIARPYVRLGDGGEIVGMARSAVDRTLGARDARIAAVAIGAAQHDGRVRVHRRAIARAVAADAAFGGGQRLRFAATRAFRHLRGCRAGGEEHAEKHGAHQNVSTMLTSAEYWSELTASP